MQWIGCRSRGGMRRACRAALQLRLSSTAVGAGPSRSIADQNGRRRGTVSVMPTMSPQDEKLIQRGEFHGVAATSGGKKAQIMQSPELALSRLHENLRRNYRVNAESVMVDLILRLESGDQALISLLRRTPDRWIPMSIRCCGRALSSLQLEGRKTIAKRLWNQIVERELPISIESYNALLKVKLENENKWSPWEILKEIEEKHRLVPDQETFHLLLQKLSIKGEIKDCSKMCYEMARHGQSPSDAISHSHLVYANAVRGYDHKADSMIEQALTKFGPEGEALSLGAACVAAASGEKIDRLRAVLRRSVDENLRLRLPIESVFEIIWALSEKSGDNEKNYQAVMEEILSRTQHPQGFFRFLYREIERHIFSSHFRSAMVLLGETMRVKESLQKQERNVFAEQMIARMCRAMVRSRTEDGIMMEMANRIATTMHIRDRFIHDELMLAALMLKGCDSYERFDTFSSIIRVVDPKRERPHLILPILAFSSTLDDRLKFLFRASALGYSNFEELDTGLMAQYIFQPLYKHQVWLNKDSVRNTPIMHITTDVINSYGVSKQSVWWMMNNWWKIKKEEEKNSAVEMRMRPHAEEIQTWLRNEYSTIFGKPSKDDVPTFVLSKAKLEASIEKGDAPTILSLLSSHGWPEDAPLSQFAPTILKLLLTNENNANIMKFLTALSREAALRQEQQKEEMASPLNSSHIVKVIRHSAKETPMSTKALIEMAYELKRLFPRAIYGQDSYMETIPETNRLIAACFIFKEGKDLTEEAVDDITELIRTLLKLEIIGLSQHGEIVTPYCVLKVLQRFGWKHALTLWLRFQSSFAFGNGMIILIANSLSNDNVEQSKESIQFVLHKAHLCMSDSRIHALYAAALVNTRKMEEEAVDYFKEHGSKMTPFDCALAYRLINNIKYPPSDKYFIRTFPALCLAHTPLAEKKDGEARNMLTSALKFCEARLLGPMIVEMCDMFARYGVEPDNKEKIRIENTMEEHQKLVNRWIFSPQGLIQASPDQEFVKEDEWKNVLLMESLVYEMITRLFHPFPMSHSQSIHSSVFLIEVISSESIDYRDPMNT